VRWFDSGRGHFRLSLGGMRLGDVQLIRIERSYDEKGRIEIEPKSRAGRRTVPIVGALRAVLLTAAGVNTKAITAYMGHASIQTTYNLYGKLMPGSESEAAVLVDAYLARADTSGRLDQLSASGS
jgi:integrase